LSNYTLSPHLWQEISALLSKWEVLGKIRDKFYQNEMVCQEEAILQTCRKLFPEEIVWQQLVEFALVTETKNSFSSCSFQGWHENCYISD